MKHIVERAIVPYNPSASSIINKEQYNLYAPIAGQGKVGMAAFDLRDFEVKNQTVFLHADVREGIDNALSLGEKVDKNTNDIIEHSNWIELAETRFGTNIERLNEHDKKFEKHQDALNSLSNERTTGVRLEMSDDKYVLKVVLTRQDGTTFESEVDFPIESSVVGMRFDSAEKKLVLKLRDQTEEIKVDISDIFKGTVQTLDDSSTDKALSAATGALIKDAIRKAVAEETKNRESVDTSLEARIVENKTRLDSLDLPIIQKSLYEHNISIYSYNLEEEPNGDCAVFRCTLYLPFEETIHFNEIVSAIQTFQGKEVGTDGVQVDVLVGSYSGAVTIKNYDGTFTTYPIDEAVVFDDNVWSLQLNYAGGGAYTLRNETATTYDVVRAIADVAESGGGGNAIVECLELPTQNISTAHLYRTPDGKLHWNDGTNWHTVIEEDDIPESSGTGNTYFVGTLAEYEAQKDTIPVGALIIITDEGDEESAILGQAILGKMILGKGA